MMMLAIKKTEYYDIQKNKPNNEEILPTKKGRSQKR